MDAPAYLPVPLTDGEFAAPTGMATPAYSSGVVHQLLCAPSARGRKIAVVILALSVASLAAARWFGDRALQAFTGALAIGVGLLTMHLRRQNAAASVIAWDPARVACAHPTVLCADGDLTRRLAIYATFHLVDGRKFEVAMNADQLVGVFAWLKRGNPAVKLLGRLPPPLS